MSNKPDLKIHEDYGFIDEEKTLMYRSVSWNGSAPRDELRKVYKNNKGEVRNGAGVTITDDDINRLYAIKAKKLAKNGIDFNSVFEAADNIEALRGAGYVTKNGYISLVKK